VILIAADSTLAANPANAANLGAALHPKTRRLRERLLQPVGGGALIAAMIEVEEATRIAEALGLRREGAAKRRRKNGRSCEECFFHRRLLCALDLDEPCSTFRADSPQGLVPPRQPALLMRDAAETSLATR
jgi:hypothetical protein